MRKQEGGALRPAGRSSLDEAIWQARIAQAEQSDVVADLRAGEIARLAMVEDALAELVAQLPDGDDQFDFALVPGTPPRFWVDMVAFVIMDRDRKTYRFVRDTRAGRQFIAESTDPADIAAAVTGYVAHRIVERQRALAGDNVYAAPATPPRPARAGSGLGRRGGLALAFLVGLAAGALMLLVSGIGVAPWPY